MSKVPLLITLKSSPLFPEARLPRGPEGDKK